jgi:hypothetical protein
LWCDIEKYSTPFQTQALFLKIDIPSKILYSGERGEIFQLLHLTSSGIEKEAA